MWLPKSLLWSLKPQYLSQLCDYMINYSDCSIQSHYRGLFLALQPQFLASLYIIPDSMIYSYCYHLALVYGLQPLLLTALTCFLCFTLNICCQDSYNSFVMTISCCSRLCDSLLCTCSLELGTYVDDWAFRALQSLWTMLDVENARRGK